MDSTPILSMDSQHVRTTLRAGLVGSIHGRVGRHSSVRGQEGLEVLCETLLYMRSIQGDKGDDENGANGLGYGYHDGRRKGR